MIRNVLLLFLFSFSQAFAWPPTYGSEFNFTNKEITKAWTTRGEKANFDNSSWGNPDHVEQEYAKTFADEIQQACGRYCTITPHRGKFGATEFRVEFKDGYKFNISVDPANVEIQTSPETLLQVEKYEEKTQRYIFDIAKKMGMIEHSNDETAHLNIGLASAFDNDAKRFLRFYTNYQNHPELASGALGIDFPNAPPLTHLTPMQKKAFAEIVDDVNSGKETSAKVVATRIQDEVYTKTPTFGEAPYHYQGFSVKQIAHSRSSSDKPFELRAPRQPKSARERTLLIKLFEMRMAADNESSNPIAFLDLPENQQIPRSELTNKFRLYLLDAGADFDEFKDLLPERLRFVPPDAFLSGKIDWKNPAHRKTVKSYAPYLASSPWARNQMKIVLEQKGANKYKEEILKNIRSSYGKYANTATKNFLAGFPDTIDSLAQEAIVLENTDKTKSTSKQINSKSQESFCARLFANFF
jgi:hypothetical protein